jgi:hypothetical protein
VDDHAPDAPGRRPETVDDLPTVSCTRCGREWTLGYELDELVAGNQAVEQFALDHKQHTGHFPDDAATWLARCRNCPDGVERLSSRAARRWAEVHARHTRHSVAVSHGTDGDPVLVEPGDWKTASGDDGDRDADPGRGGDGDHGDRP